MRLYVGGLGILLYVTLIIWIPILHPESKSPPKPSLAERIANACPKGYKVTNWNLVKHTVYIECGNNKSGNLEYADIQWSPHGEAN